MAEDLLLLARGFFRKLALAKKSAAMETEKMSVQKVRDIFEEGPSQVDLKPKIELLKEAKWIGIS